MNYETIEKAYKIANELSKEKRMILLEVLDYADSCYVDHCEKIGSIAIEQIESIRDDIKGYFIQKLDSLKKDIEHYE